MTAPVRFTWDGESMVPIRQHQRLADREFVVGEEYLLVEHQERSNASHNHYFALIKDAWDSLPEVLADRFPTTEHLRKYALIKAGFRDERSIVCATKADAERMAGFIKPMDEFAVVTHHEATVVVLTAKSQSAKAMGKEDFQASKEAVLGVLADMIGVEPSALGAQGRSAA